MHAGNLEQTPGITRTKSIGIEEFKVILDLLYGELSLPALKSENFSNTMNFVAAAKHHLTFAPSANKRTTNLP